MKYVNDNGDHATIVEQDGKIKVYTDLSAKEKTYDTIDDAKHDLVTSGFYRKNPPIKNMLRFN